MEKVTATRAKDEYGPLVRAAADGDPAAMDLLLRRAQEVARRFSRTVCGDETDAEDALQEALLKTYRSARQIRDANAFRPWLYRIVRNACLLSRRKRVDEPHRFESLDAAGRGLDGVAAIDPADPGRDPEQLAEEARRRTRLHAALAEIPRAHRAVLFLRDMEGLSTREVALTARLAHLPIWIDADSTRVSQALGNVLQNAAKFTNPGGLVEVTADRDAHGMAFVQVRDDGVGIERDLLGRIFEPFTQADESLHRTRGGLGLGLSLVKGLVELHGGTVEARSDGVGSGAELVLRLPLAPEQRVLSGDPRTTGASMPARRVLVVEDNGDAADTLREMLELWGHEVAVAHDGRAGVEQARAFRPDVVLCDIGLPVMDGYEVARAIRADPELASTFLVAVTGYALPEDQRRAAEAGFTRHLGKPVPIEILEEVLATAPRPAR